VSLLRGTAVARSGRRGFVALIAVLLFGSTIVAELSSASPVTAASLPIQLVDPLAQGPGFDDPNGFFGYSVALSADGNTAIVGAFVTADSIGAVYVFVQSNGNWTLQATLSDPDATAGDEFGDAVALSDDGSVALVGAPGTHGNVGDAYTFTRPQGGWSNSSTPSATMDNPTGEADANYAATLALSGDGNTALIGAQGATQFTAGAFVFAGSSGTWTLQAQLFAPNFETFGFFASAVALSDNGTTAIVGAEGETNLNNDSIGAAYVYNESGGAWSGTPTPTPTAVLSDGGANNALEFGYGVALSADGQTALVGAPGVTGPTTGAYLYTEPNAGWASTDSPSASLADPTGSANDDDWFGRSVALSGDGDTAVVGAPAALTSSGTSAAYRFTNSNGDWTESGQYSVTGVSHFGWGLGVSSDGSTVLASSYTTGTAYVFPPSAAVATTTAVTSSENPANIGDSVTYTATVTPTPDGGTVAFSDGGVPISGCGGKTLNMATGTATCMVTYSSAASPSITAAFTPLTDDASFTQSSSNAFSETVEQITPLPPTAVAATGDNNTVHLAWNAPSSDGTSALTGFGVFRSTTPGGEGNTALAVLGPKTTVYDDTTVSNGITYYYYVEAINSTGPSDPSSEVQVTPPTSGSSQTLTACTFPELEVDIAQGGTIDFGCDSTINFTQPIRLSANKPVVLEADGHTAILNGQNGTSLFTVPDGGNLTLNGVTVENGLAQGAAGQDGPDGDAGTTGALGVDGTPGNNSDVNGAIVTTGSPNGGNGTAGGDGGDGTAGFSGTAGGVAKGGAISVARGGTLSVIGGAFNNDDATGGNGGNGGIGGNGGEGGDSGAGGNGGYANGICGNGGNGGNGGHAGDGGSAGSGGAGGGGEGGAIYSAGSVTISDGTSFSNDQVQGGSGGDGGKGGAGGLGGGGQPGGSDASHADSESSSSCSTSGEGEAGSGGTSQDSGDSGNGGNGGAGGVARGGAIDNDDGALTVTDATFTGDSGTSGDGGDGGLGGAAAQGIAGGESGAGNAAGTIGGGVGGDGGDSGAGGNGGGAGQATGGGLYSNVAIDLEQSSFTANAVTAGNGGDGGDATDAGDGGTGGDAGSSTVSGNGGNGGDGGNGGNAGLGGSAAGGAGYLAATSSVPDDTVANTNAVTGGLAGAAGDAGDAGSAGTAGGGLQPGDPGSGGTDGEDGTTALDGVGLIAGVYGPAEPPESPGPPQDVAASAGVSASVVSWVAPSPLPADTIQGYTVTGVDATNSEPLDPQILPPGATSAEFDNLQPGDKYAFSVEAANTDGTGPAVTSNSVVPVEVDTTTSDSGTSASSGGTASASVGTAGQPGSLSASATGSGTVTVGDYPSAPLAGFSVGQSWFDVSVSPGSAFSLVQFTVCGIPQGDVVEWWNPAQQALAPASQQTAATSGGCITVTVTTTTTPAISDLFGTIFGEGVAASGTPPTITTTPVTTTTGTTTGPPMTQHAGPPRIVVSTGTLKLHGWKTDVKLSCKVAACSGVAELTTTRTVAVRKRKKITHKRETVLLAKTTYKLSVNRVKNLVLALKATGRSFVAHASSRRPVPVTLTVTLARGKKVTKTVRIA
jgi:hypothetical protein